MRLPKTSEIEPHNSSVQPQVKAKIETGLQSAKSVLALMLGLILGQDIRTYQSTRPGGMDRSIIIRGRPTMTKPLTKLPIPVLHVMHTIMAMVLTLEWLDTGCDVTLLSTSSCARSEGVELSSSIVSDMTLYLQGIPSMCKLRQSRLEALDSGCSGETYGTTI